ncbi:MAG: cell division protein FtsQ/DivIB [Acidimicrobiia bacterium]
MNTVSLDSRLRHRRVDVARAEGRRRLRRLLISMATLVALTLMWIAAHSSLLGVRSISLDGSQRTDKALVLAALASAGVHNGTPMLDARLDEATRAVEALPWVDRARVTKQWPASIEVTITERRPVAASAAADGTWRLVDRTGRVLDRLTELKPGIPTVAGAIEPGDPGTELPAQARLAYEAIARVPSSLAGEVVSTMWDNTGAAAAVLANGQMALLPGPERLGDAFVALDALLAAGDVPAGLIDLRVPTNPVITPIAEGTGGSSASTATDTSNPSGTATLTGGTR